MDDVACLWGYYCARCIPGCSIDVCLVGLYVGAEEETYWQRHSGHHLPGM